MTAISTAAAPVRLDPTPTTVIVPGHPEREWPTSFSIVDGESWASDQSWASDPKVVVDMIADLPKGLVDAYAQAARRHAWIEELDDGHWFASVAGLEGVWGDGDSAEAARDDLCKSIIGWVAVRRERKLTIPAVEGYDLNF